MPPQRRASRGGRAGGLWTAVRIDLARLHAGWMAVPFPRLRDQYPVGAGWTPTTPFGRLGYWLWAAFGVATVALVYPFALAGFAVRYYGLRLYGAADTLGPRKLLALSLGVWGAFTVAVALLGFPVAGVAAVAVGGSVAAASAILALAFARWDGRAATVLLAAPFGVTAIFLPPVVAARYSTALATWVFPASDALAIWLLDGPLAVGGLAAVIRADFDLVGLAYVAMWFALSVPVGWALGLLVALADLVRARDPPRNPQ